MTTFDASPTLRPAGPGRPHALGTLTALRRLAVGTGAALVLLTTVLLVRGLWSPRRLAGVLAVLALAGTLAIAAGPARSLGSDLAYTVQSLALQTPNASSSQRFGELRSLDANTDGVMDVAAVRGLGALWNSAGSAPIDVVSFGSKETAFVRVGWHIVGLEWLYKLGVVGVLGLLLVLAMVALRIREVMPRVSDRLLRSYAWSLPIPHRSAARVRPCGFLAPWTRGSPSRPIRWTRCRPRPSTPSSAERSSTMSSRSKRF